MSGTKPNWGAKSKANSLPKRIDMSDLGDDNVILKEVNKQSLYPDPNQPRQEFNEESLTELKTSIEKNGLLQPILVTEEPQGDDKKYRIIAGERRWRAIMASDSIKRIQVVIRNDISDELKILLAQIAENIHRENMTVIETATSYKRVLEAVNGDVDRAIQLLHISRTRFSTTIGLNNADEQVKELAQEGITKDVDALASLNVLANLNSEKATEAIEQIRTGEISKKGLRKTVSELVKEEKQAKKQNNNTQTNDSTSDKTAKNNRAKKERIYSVDFSQSLMEDLVAFLIERQNDDENLFIKDVLLALKNAKK